jgi:hypothetical protein
VVFIAGMVFIFRNRILKSQVLARYFLFGIILVFGYIFFELNVITTQHDYYLFPLLPFLFLISVYGFREMCKNKNLKWIAVLCVVILPVTAFLRINTRWNLEDPGFNRDLLVNKDAIRASIPKDAICLVGNDDSQMINLYYLARRGYTFYNDSIGVKSIEEYKNKGVTYLVSDAALNDETVSFLGAPVASFNSIKVFRLP